MITIGIIGTGGMANAHAEAFSKIKGVKMAACCDVVVERAQAFADKWKIPNVYTDYRELLAKEALDGISNVTIDRVHAEVAITALKRKICVLCEKPLATTLAEARQMAAAAKRAGVINMVNFSYRNSAGLQAAARVVQEGKIGRIIHVESSYLQSWLCSKIWGDWQKSSALLWRLCTQHGSAGVLGDIGCHIYDLTSLLAGDIDQLYCTLKTFDKGVPGNRIGKYHFDANDSFISNVVFRNGALGTIHSSRWATGHANSLRARVYGDKGAVEVDLDTTWDGYKICHGEKCVDTCGWTVVKCKPTPTNYQRFINAIRTGKPDPSDFANGVKIQAYLHYSLESDRKNAPVKIKI